MDASKALDTALAVKRGEVKLADVPDKDRGPTLAALRLSDAKLGVYAASKERPRSALAFSVPTRIRVTRSA